VHIFGVLFRQYDILPTRVVHTTKDFRYLLNIHCGINRRTSLFLFLFYWYDYVLQLRTWTWTRSYVVLAHLDLTWTWLLLDLIQVCKLETRRVVTFYLPQWWASGGQKFVTSYAHRLT